MTNQSYTQRQSALNTILNIISSAGTYGAQMLMYITALGAVAVLGGVNLPADLQPLLGNLGVNILATLIDRVANGENVSDTEIKKDVERAINESKLQKLLTKKEFSDALEILVSNQSRIIEISQTNSRELRELRSKLSELSLALKHQRYISTRLGPEVFNRKPDRNLLDKKVGHRFLTVSIKNLVLPLPRGSFSIGLADIDNLTQINNLYGPQVGDAILAAIVNTLTRAGDTPYIGRCGDDTFYAVFLNRSLAKAKDAVEVLRFQIKHLPWTALATNLRVTCSFGLAERRIDEPIEDTIARAAVGLVKAKEAGENIIKLGPKFLAYGQSRSLRNYYS